MHFEDVKGVLSPKGNMNIYRGSCAERQKEENNGGDGQYV